MREVPCDIGPLQEEFCETVVSMFNDPDGECKILGTNFADDPFEPNIVVMDTDEWVFNVPATTARTSPATGSSSCSSQPSG